MVGTNGAKVRKTRRVWRTETSSLLLGNICDKMAAVSPPRSSPVSSISSEILDVNVSRHFDSGNNQYEEIPVHEHDVSILTPVFFGRFPRRIHEIVHSDSEHMSSDSQMHLNLINSTQSKEEIGSLLEFDAAVLHPATFGYVLLDKKPVIQEEEEILKPLPDPQKCSPQEYVQVYIFPMLLPALEKMLVEAKNNKVFEKRRTKFNACDFLTSYLYSNNPNYKDRDDLELEEIPFVKEILAINPRPPIPLSLLLSDNEAAVIIQSYYRGYQVRKDPEVQELREYQKEMREEEVDINFRVEDFWRKRSLEMVE